MKGKRYAKATGAVAKGRGAEPRSTRAMPGQKRVAKSNPFHAPGTKRTPRSY